MPYLALPCSSFPSLVIHLPRCCIFPPVSPSPRRTSFSPFHVTKFSVSLLLNPIRCPETETRKGGGRTAWLLDTQFILLSCLVVHYLDGRSAVVSCTGAQTNERLTMDQPGPERPPEDIAKGHLLQPVDEELGQAQRLHAAAALPRCAGCCFLARDGCRDGVEGDEVPRGPGLGIDEKNTHVRDEERGGVEVEAVEVREAQHARGGASDRGKDGPYAVRPCTSATGSFSCPIEKEGGEGRERRGSGGRYSLVELLGVVLHVFGAEGLRMQELRLRVRSRCVGVHRCSGVREQRRQAVALSSDSWSSQSPSVAF